MLKEEKERSGWSVYCVIDTSALFGYPEQIEKLGRDLAKREFDNKKGVDGKIVIPEVVRGEVNKYYQKVSEQKEEKLLKQLFSIRSWAQAKTLFKERCKRKQFVKNVTEAKLLIDKLKNNPNWMLKHENPDIMLILTTQLLNEPGVYKKVWEPKKQVENPAGNSDLIILATAMQLSRHGVAFVVTCDSGLANAIIYVNKKLGYRRVIVKRDVSGPWFKNGNNNKKGD